ncbi:DNA helicase/exodeoxyribonuclease V, subunit A [Hathewaya proteolytica DSM 3090]|uniref:ATP-dependent helicase/nuclease subunit A n=1 Tax=Hathewaya proteolytica DSM 3090 TaxID=1121331 RepID=A0A1M6NDX5_9CLOT|nr:helicase-exonuclease AddAB subunit AddA [Hathewaya proteolytica]SHJ93806.1 DNA helicase/exodeoxyribonuclease V, subunit A [Hathewaya proteolytica DSM 3090]
MSKVEWTKEQKQVIDARHCNLLVAAAAGSGKTAVLVERIIQMIIDKKAPVDIDRLLVVTFTNAAASEMRERIADALSKEISKGENYARLQRQLTLLNKASITTIHSFCLNLIRNNFHKINLDPGFRVADETEVLLLKNETMEEVFEENYDNNEEFQKLVDVYGSNRDDSKLMDLVLRIYEFSISSPNPSEWLYNSLENLNPTNIKTIEDLNFINILKDNLRINLQGICAQYDEIYNMSMTEAELEKYSAFILEEGEQIKFLNEKLQNGEFSDFMELLQGLTFQRMPTIKKLENVELKEQIKGIRDDLKKEITKLKENYSHLTIETIIEGYEKMYPVLKILCSTVMEFSQKFSMKKRRKGIIDFNDFEHFAIDLLVAKNEDGSFKKDENGEYIPTAVALDMREKYSEILIDEYQDSNFTQELILNMVSTVKEGKANIFMVGDIKQSIYRFRQAKPELFLHKYNTYSDEESADYRRIMLFKNFRSRQQVIDGVNFIFKAIMSEKVGELNYDDKEALYLGADFPNLDEGENGVLADNIDMELVDLEEVLLEEEKNGVQGENAELEEEKEEEITAIALEARLVAKKIQQMMENTLKPCVVYDKTMKSYRKVTYRDVVILLRSTANRADTFVKELKEQNIPCYADVSTGYFDTTEIKTMLSLLEVIDNPRQDIPLLCVMRCVTMGNFTAEELIDVKINTSFGNIYSRCIEYRDKFIHDEDEELKTSLAKKLHVFIERLQQWRKKSLYMPTDELIWYLYTDTGYYGFVGALPNGVQRQANLKVLFQRAKEYENTSYKGLFNFINFINKLKSNSGDMGSAKILGENENVVRIMSIHKSKGLEFPVVFLCSIQKKFNLMDLNSNMLLDYDLGFGPDLVDTDLRITYPLPVKKAVREKILMDTLSEEMRILYVALTRAREKLILVGSVKSPEKYVEKIYNNTFHKNGKVLEYSIMKSRSYLEWILYAMGKGKKNDEPCNIDINYWSLEDLKNIEEENLTDRGEVLREALKEYMEGGIDESLYDIIDERLTYKTITNCEKVPTVVTVSEIKHRYNSFYHEDDDTVANNGKSALDLKRLPKFLQGERALTPAERGTATHAVMQYVDLSNVYDEKSIKDQIQKMISRELITEEEGNGADTSAIYKFFQSELGKEMISSFPRVYREKEFHIPIDAGELVSDECKHCLQGKKVLLQGIIDCYFITKENKVVLLDYKTDYIKNGEEEKFLDKYRLQLHYYERAVEKLTGRKVDEKFVYSFYLNKTFKY